MKFLPIGSGSCAHSSYLQSSRTAILIDLGLGIRIFKRHIQDYGLALPRIKAVLVTHDHTDHIKGLGPLAIAQHIPVYASEYVHIGIDRNRMMTKKIPQEQRHTTTLDVSFDVGPFRITPFAVMHDSNDCNGYFIEIVQPEPAEDLFDAAKAEENPDGEPLTFCIITDCGTFTENLIPYVKRARYLVIEANYDMEMLRKGHYPERLKRRIMGERGHMDNRVCAKMLAAHLTACTKRIFLCHLSEENNHPVIAENEVKAALQQTALPQLPAVNALRRRVPSGIFILK